MARDFIIDASSYPDLPQLMLATLSALRATGGSASLNELDDKVIELEEVTEDEQSISMPNDNRLKVNYYLAWARTYLKRGGTIENSKRGVWSLTERGEKITQLDDVRQIYRSVHAEERERARRERREREESQPNDNSPSLDEINSSDRDVSGTLELNWRERLLAAIGKMESEAFERLSQRLLREAGFTKVEVRGKIGDGGIDGVGVLRVDLVSFQVYFQCKKWNSSVGAREIRDFRGALQGRADKGLFITTGNFTTQAFEEATRDGAIAIDLIDGDRLCDLLKQYQLGIRTEMVESVDVDENGFSAF